MRITTDLLRTWNACREGYAWFAERYPDGEEYAITLAALAADGRRDWVAWLTERVWRVAMAGDADEFIRGEVARIVEDTKGSPNSSSGDGSTAASS
ncbi:MAG: hypothetical protein IT514_14835, partial [Burkholderiales bacterium]|nr:hypothetical protein [Burkholderiales bacterium]